jgi:hypothetical protein
MRGDYADIYQATQSGAMRHIARVETPPTGGIPENEHHNPPNQFSAPFSCGEKNLFGTSRYEAVRTLR